MRNVPLYLHGIIILSKSNRWTHRPCRWHPKKLKEAGMTLAVKNVNSLRARSSTLVTLSGLENSRLIALILHLSIMLSLLRTNRNCALSKDSATSTDGSSAISHTKQARCILYSKRTPRRTILLVSNKHKLFETWSLLSFLHHPQSSLDSSWNTP